MAVNKCEYFHDECARLRTSIKRANISRIESGKHYPNLETLEKKKLIAYDNRMIKFTDAGLKELKKIDAEIKQFTSIEKYFSMEKIKIKRSLQTVIR